MDQPLELTFRNMRPSAEIEALVRKHIAKLEKLFERIVWCRVAIEAPSKRSQSGGAPFVHVELHVPGQSLIVKREHHVKERHHKPDVESAVRDAFDSITLKLKDYKSKLHHEVKEHPAPHQARVSSLRRDRDFGFLTTNEGKELYFHRNSLMNGAFDALKDGDVVQFVEGSGDTGPTASKVWLAGNGKN